MSNCCEKYFKSEKPLPFCPNCGTKNSYVLSLDYELKQEVEKIITEKFPGFDSSGNRHRCYTYMTSSKYANQWYDAKTSSIVKKIVSHWQHSDRVSTPNFPYAKIHLATAITFRDLIEEAARKRFSDILFIGTWIYFGLYGGRLEDIAYFINTEGIYPLDGLRQNAEWRKRIENDNIITKVNKWFPEFATRFSAIYYLDESQNPPKLLLESELDAHLHPLLRTRFSINVDKLPIHIINTADPAKPIIIRILGRDFGDFCRVSQYIAEIHEPIGRLLQSQAIMPKPRENAENDPIYDIIDMFAK